MIDSKPKINKGVSILYMKDFENSTILNKIQFFLLSKIKEIPRNDISL